MGLFQTLNRMTIWQHWIPCTALFLGAVCSAISFDNVRSRFLFCVSGPAFSVCWFRVLYLFPNQWFILFSSSLSFSSIHFPTLLSMLSFITCNTTHCLVWTLDSNLSRILIPHCPQSTSSSSMTWQSLHMSHMKPRIFLGSYFSLTCKIKSAVLITVQLLNLWR